MNFSDQITNLTVQLRDNSKGSQDLDQQRNRFENQLAQCEEEKGDLRNQISNAQADLRIQVNLNQSLRENIQNLERGNNALGNVTSENSNLVARIFELQ